MDLLIQATIRHTIDDSFIDEWGQDEGEVQSLAREELAWRLLRGDLPGEPYHALEFLRGQGQVMRIWHEGVAGLRVAGKRKLTLPDRFPYGVRGVGDVAPSRATLVFELEFLGVQWVGTPTIFFLGPFARPFRG